MSTLVLQATSPSATVLISTASTRPISTVSASKKQDNENQMYTKRGSKRKADTFMEEAVSAIKTLCQPDPITSLEPNLFVSRSSQYPDNDSAHTLGLFIAARLRAMQPEERRLCENEILKLLSQF